MNLLKQSWTQARANRANAILYILGVALAVCTVMIISIIWHVKLDPIYPEYNRDRTAYLSKVCIKVDNDIQHSSMYGGLTEQMIEEFTTDLDCVEAVGISEPMEAVVRKLGTKSLITASGFNINSDFLRIYNYDLLAGRQFTDSEIESLAPKVMIDENLAKKLYGSAAEAVGKEIEVSFSPREIVGVFRPTSGLAKKSCAEILAPIEFKGNPNVMTAAYSAAFLLKDNRDFDKLRQELEERLRRHNSVLTDGMSVEFDGDPVDHKTYAFNSVTHSGYIYYIGIALILLMVPAMNLCGLITENLNRRQEEIGVRKSFGASRGSLVWEIATENLLLTVAGSLIGLAISWILISLCGNWVLQVSDTSISLSYSSTPITWEMLWSWRIFAICIAAAFLLNLVSSLIPVWLRLRRPIVQSLSSGNRDAEGHGLMSRISSNVWIFLELVFITLLAWSIVDPIAVNKAEDCDNPGYDFDQLFTIGLRTFPQNSVLYDSTLTSNEAVWEQRQHIMDKIRALPEVESCTQVSNWMLLEDLGSFRSSVAIDSTNTISYYKVAFFAWDRLFLHLRHKTSKSRYYCFRP